VRGRFALIVEDMVLGRLALGLMAFEQRPYRPTLRHRKRTRLEIYSTILEALAAENMTANRLTIRLNFNHRFTKECVSFLVARGLVEASGEWRPVLYSITSTGLDWLTRFKQVVRELESRDREVCDSERYKRFSRRVIA